MKKVRLLCATWHVLACFYASEIVENVAKTSYIKLVVDK